MSLLSQFYNCGETTTSSFRSRAYGASLSFPTASPSLIISEGVPIATGGFAAPRPSYTAGGFDVYEGITLTTVPLRIAAGGGFPVGLPNSIAIDFKYIGDRTSTTITDGVLFSSSGNIGVADFSDSLMCSGGGLCEINPEPSSFAGSCTTFVLGWAPFVSGGTVTAGRSTFPVTNIDTTYWRVNNGSVNGRTLPLTFKLAAPDCPLTRESIDNCIIKMAELYDQTRADGATGACQLEIDFSNNTAGNGGVANLSAAADAARTYLVGEGATITV